MGGVMNIKFEKLDFQSSESYYVQIANIIERKIKNKEVSVGKKLPPEEDLRKVFNVSLDTMREAMAKLTEEGYITRRPSIGTVVVSAQPKKGVDLEKKKGIGLVVCNVPGIDISEGPYSNGIIKGIEEEIRDRGFYAIFRGLDAGDDKLTFVGKKREISGLVVTGAITLSHLRTIKKFHLPFVLVGDVYKKTKVNVDTDVVTDSEFESIYIAVKHLIGLGHKKIVFVRESGEDVWWRMEQIEGYVQAFKEANLEYDKNMVIEKGRADYESGYSVMKEFLNKSVPFTAVICNGNIQCLGVIQAIKEKGLRIPEDISVIRKASTNSSGLTTISCDYEVMGRKAVERLIYRLENTDRKPERIIIPAELIVSNSTALRT
jgi:LacI family transcriptional regulator